MASIYTTIRTVLETTLNGGSDFYSNNGITADIAWENVDYSPTTGSSYLKTFFMPTTRTPAHRGLNPQMYYQGVFTVECYTPLGLGPSVGDTLANQVIDLFPVPNDLTVNGSTVSLNYAERELGTVEGAFYMIPVNIGWYTYA